MKPTARVINQMSDLELEEHLRKILKQYGVTSEEEIKRTKKEIFMCSPVSVRGNYKSVEAIAYAYSKMY